MMPSSTVEASLLAIYSLNYENTEVIAARLAERLSVSAPTVSATMDRMVRDGYVTVNNDHSIELTDHGLALAEGGARPPGNLSPRESYPGQRPQLVQQRNGPAIQRVAWGADASRAHLRAGRGRRPHNGLSPGEAPHTRHPAHGPRDHPVRERRNTDRSRDGCRG